MKEENTTIESLIKGGLIGAALGALLSKDKEEGAIIGTLLGAAFSATSKASEEAKKTAVPVYVEEDGKLFEIISIDQKRFVKNIEKNVSVLPEQFKLK
jgi:pyruvoyl-dependent arginine decarboxylase (PvlArgDC)